MSSLVEESDVRPVRPPDLELTILMPCLNEAETIGACITKARTALVATGENPEVFGYQSFIKILYRVVAALFWPLVPIFLVAVAAIAMRSPRVTIRTRLIAFALSLMVIDVLCRVSFYSLVDWILWELPPRYMLGANVLSVIIVSTLLTLWLAPAAGRMLGPKLVRFPGFLFGPKVASIPVVPPSL